MTSWDYNIHVAWTSMAMSYYNYLTGRGTRSRRLVLVYSWNCPACKNRNNKKTTPQSITVNSRKCRNNTKRTQQKTCIRRWLQKLQWVHHRAPQKLHYQSLAILLSLPQIVTDCNTVNGLFYHHVPYGGLRNSCKCTWTSRVEKWGVCVIQAKDRRKRIWARRRTRLWLATRPR